MISAVSFCQKNETVPFASLEKVPVYPGCEIYQTNLDLKKCLSQKLREFVSHNFHVSVGKSSPLAGRQRISIQFRINKEGKVDDVKARGPHPALEREAKRVMADVPAMKPGIEKGKPVGVLYSLPIIFGKETNEQKKARKKQERKTKKTS